MNYERTIKVFSLCDKLKVVHAFESGKSRSEIINEFGLPESTYYKILKNKDSIKCQCSEGNGNVKRQRRGDYPNVEKCLSNWVRQAIAKDMSVTGPVLKRKALEFAHVLGIANFPASGSWLDGFKRRNNIVLKKSHSKTNQPEPYTPTDFSDELQNLINGYGPNDIYAAGETGLFFKCLPDQTFAFKALDCEGGKNGSERLTILHCANMTGTDKLSPLVIGKSKHPACFEGVKTLPLDYGSNQYAWMTVEIFREWLKNIDTTMKRKQRKIILFLDNHFAHTNFPDLTNVDVSFLPLDAPQKFQPFDQGIAYNFKRYYRKEVTNYILTCLDKTAHPDINVLLAMRFVRKAWYTVNDSSIMNCFRKAGFCSRMFKQNFEAEEDHGEIKPSDVAWHKLTANNRGGDIPTFEDFLAVDDDLPIAEDRRDDKEDEQGDERFQTIDRKPVLAEHALQALETLHRFFEMSTGTDQSVYDQIYELEMCVEKAKERHMKCTDYLR